MPTGTSVGPAGHRAIVSVTTRNEACEGTRRKEDPVVGPNEQPHDVWHDESDEANHTGDGDARCGNDARQREQQ